MWRVNSPFHYIVTSGSPCNGSRHQEQLRNGAHLRLLRTGCTHFRGRLLQAGRQQLWYLIQFISQVGTGEQSKPKPVTEYITALVVSPTQLCWRYHSLPLRQWYIPCTSPCDRSLRRGMRYAVYPIRFADGLLCFISYGLYHHYKHISLAYYLYSLRLQWNKPEQYG